MGKTWTKDRQKSIIVFSPELKRKKVNDAATCCKSITFFLSRPAAAATFFSVMFRFFLRAAAAAEFLADSAYLRSAHADELIGKQRLLSHISIKSRFMTRPGLQPCAPQLLSCWELRVFCRFSYFSAWSRFWLQQSNLMVEIVLNLCQIFFSCVEFQSCVLCGQIAVPWFLSSISTLHFCLEYVLFCTAWLPGQIG